MGVNAPPTLQLWTHTLPSQPCSELSKQLLLERPWQKQQRHPLSPVEPAGCLPPQEEPFRIPCRNPKARGCGHIASPWRLQGGAQGVMDGTERGSRWPQPWAYGKEAKDMWTEDRRGPHLHCPSYLSTQDMATLSVYISGINE